jgi:hypothetical protein
MTTGSIDDFYTAASRIASALTLWDARADPPTGADLAAGQAVLDAGADAGEALAVILDRVTAQRAAAGCIPLDGGVPPINGGKPIKVAAMGPDARIEDRRAVR